MKLRNLIRIAVVGVTLTMGISVAAILFYGRYASPAEADVIIVLGCRIIGEAPTPMLRLRLEKAIELYEEGLATHIIVSGGQGPDEDIAEALAMKRFLVQRGVNPEKILLEDASTSTRENLQFSRELMEQAGFRHGIIVTNDFHIFRSLFLSRRMGIAATAAPASVPPVSGLRTRYIMREILALWKDVIVR